MADYMFLNAELLERIKELETQLKEANETILFLSDARDAVFRSNRKLAIAVDALASMRLLSTFNERDAVYSETLDKIRE
jgi:hypothetical protein